MKDLRFIYGNASSYLSEKMKNVVKAFKIKGDKFNKKYETSRNTKQEYENLKTKKDNSWKEFKSDFVLFSGGRCSICENTINKNDDIEHFRPKNYYWWLAYDYKNYTIYCDLCNRTYKKTEFPLFTDFKIEFKNRDKIKHEKPLIFNPTTDNPKELFELEFVKFTLLGHKFKIKTLSSLSSDSYFYKKANHTIELFNLNGENEDKNPIDTFTRKQNAENLFADLYYLAIFWEKFKDNPTDGEVELQFFNKLKIVRDMKKIDLAELILNDNYLISGNKNN